jgi:hypothetical protein
MYRCHGASVLTDVSKGLARNITQRARRIVSKKVFDNGHSITECQWWNG